MGIHDLWIFVAAGLLLIVTPGPDMALVVARSTQRGRTAGIAAALGIGSGLCVHIAAAAIGISALLMASAWAFTLIKWVGALYLLYIGLAMIRASFAESSGNGTAALPPTADFRSHFLEGMLTNVLNPKIAVFFLALLPQFIDADSPSKALAFVALGLLFNLMGTTWNLLVAVTAGRLGASAAFGRARTWLERVIGALFVGLGARLAMAERP